jgi:hypothetical protein
MDQGAMMDAHILDARGVYLRTVQVDPMGPQPAGAVYAALPAALAGCTRVWQRGAWSQVPDAWVPAPVVPVAVAPVAAARELTSLEFLELFTGAEQRGIKAASFSDVDVGLWYDKMLAAQFITAADARTQNGLAALVAGGLLQAHRPAEILAAMQ